MLSRAVVTADRRIVIDPLFHLMVFTWAGASKGVTWVKVSSRRQVLSTDGDHCKIKSIRCKSQIRAFPAETGQVLRYQADALFPTQETSFAGRGIKCRYSPSAFHSLGRRSQPVVCTM